MKHNRLQYFIHISYHPIITMNRSFLDLSTNSVLRMNDRPACKRTVELNFNLTKFDGKENFGLINIEQDQNYSVSSTVTGMRLIIMFNSLHFLGSWFLIEGLFRTRFFKCI